MTSFGMDLLADAKQAIVKTNSEITPSQEEQICREAMLNAMKMQMELSKATLMVLWKAEQDKVYLYSDQQYSGLYDWVLSVREEIMSPHEAQESPLSDDYLKRLVRVAMTTLDAAERLRVVTDEGEILGAEELIESVSARKLITMSSVFSSPSLSDETAREILAEMHKNPSHKELKELKTKAEDEIIQNGNNQEIKRIEESKEQIKFAVTFNEDGTVTIVGTMPNWKLVLIEAKLKSEAKFEYAY